GLPLRRRGAALLPPGRRLVGPRVLLGERLPRADGNRHGALPLRRLPPPERHARQDRLRALRPGDGGSGAGPAGAGGDHALAGLRSSASSVIPEPNTTADSAYIHHGAVNSGSFPL